jgi:hypothetical protein
MVIEAIFNATLLLASALIMFDKLVNSIPPVVGNVKLISVPDPERETAPVDKLIAALG